MSEPLTTETIASLLGELHIAFPRNIGMNNPGRMVEIYRNGLNGLPVESIRWAAKKVIEEDSYFPKVARLRELAHGWTKRAAFSMPRSATTDPYECAVCGARAKPIPITRIVRQWVGVAPAEKLVDVLGEDGRPTYETVMSQGLVMTHDRYRHGLTAAAEAEGVA